MSDTDPTQHLFWIASRSLGVVALVLVAISVGLGLALAGRAVRGPGMPGAVKRLHEATALMALIAIAAHGLLLLGDSYLRPTLAEILVPFQISHRPLYTGLGVIAGWLAAILGLSFYVRRWIGPGLWRKMHRLTLAVYVLGLAHALGAGTDAGSNWLLLTLAATFGPIVVLTGIRLLPRRAPRARPRPAPTLP